MRNYERMQNQAKLSQTTQQHAGPPGSGRSIAGCLAALILFLLGGRTDAAVHEVTVAVTTGSGKVGCHFSLVDGKESAVPEWVKTIVSVGSVEQTGVDLGYVLNVFKRDKLIKFIARDDDTHRPVTMARPLNTTVKGIVGGKGKRFVVDLSDWTDKPSGVSVSITIDGKLEFRGRGNDSHIRNWTIEHVGSGLVRISKGGDRELELTLK